MSSIASLSAVNQVSREQQGSLGAATAIHSLNKSLQLQAQSTAQLLDALPKQPALATSGRLGTQLNTIA